MGRFILNYNYMIDDDVMELQRFFYQTGEINDQEMINKVLVLGIGNYLMGDEGVGVHAIHALSKAELSGNVDLIDGGTGSFDLMPILAKYPVAIFIDATMDGAEPGTIRTLYPKFAADFPKVLSAHDVGLKDMIDALEFKGELPKIILVTVAITEMIPMSIELTPKVKESMPKLVEVVKDVISKIQF